MILLTFDDCRIAEWAAAIPLFKQIRLRATFYVSNQETITAAGWAQLHELEDAGHSIQFHGFRHVYVTRVATRPEDWEGYIKNEIVLGMGAMYAHGFNPVHFAYPYGHYSEESHRRLLPFFTSLRTLNAQNPMPYERIWGAFDYDTGRFDRLAKENAGPGAITPIVMHKVDPVRIADLAKRGDAFVTVEDVKWPR